MVKYKCFSTSPNKPSLLKLPKIAITLSTTDTSGRMGCFPLNNTSSTTPKGDYTNTNFC